MKRFTLSAVIFSIVVLGCNGYPFNGSESDIIIELALATNYDPNLVSFIHLYDKDPQWQIIALGDEDGLENSNFNPQLPTRILVHGWHDNNQTGPCIEIPKAYRQRGGYNLVMLDWSPWSMKGYSIAKEVTTDIASIIVEYVKFLQISGGLQMKDLACIGHSLGAHICGLVGKLISAGPEKLPVIIGLDPASLMYSQDEYDNRLHIGDADYVETIHTSSIYGLQIPIGQASFFPNWGYDQPGCDDGFGACDHMRSYFLFAESVAAAEDNNLIAKRCRNHLEIEQQICAGEQDEELVRMGGDPYNNARHLTGVFYLSTNADTPFAKGKIDDLL